MTQFLFRYMYRHEMCMYRDKTYMFVVASPIFLQASSFVYGPSQVGNNNRVIVDPACVCNQR